MENDNAKTPIEVCCDQSFVQIENHMKWTYFHCKQTMHYKGETRSQWNLIQVDFNTREWIWQLPLVEISQNVTTPFTITCDL